MINDHEDSRGRDIRARIKRLIVERLFLTGLDPNEIADDAPLSDQTGLDSVDALELVVGMEEEFGIEIVDKGLDQDSFRSVDSLAALVEGRLASRETS